MHLCNLQEQQRILAEVKEIETATFRPQSYTAGSAYAAVPPRLQLNDPEAYNAQLAAKQQRAELRRQQQVLERLVGGKGCWRSRAGWGCCLLAGV